MKYLPLLITCLIVSTFLVLFSCDKKEEEPEVTVWDTELIGTWNLIELTITIDGESETTPEDTLIAYDLFWDMIFMEAGQFKQTSNMGGSGDTESIEGTWSTLENDLHIVLESKFTLLYRYEINDTILVLQRSTPEQDWEILATLRKEGGG